MPLNYNRSPQVKFLLDEESLAGLEAIAKEHRLGNRGDSANEVMKLVAAQVAKVSPKLFWVMLAAMNDHQKKTFRRVSRPSTISDQLGTR